MGLSLFTYREPGKDGYFLLLVSPGDSVHDYVAKDVVYVLDTSGSMQDDDKISQARRALVHGIRGLGPEDRFNVVSFAGESRRMETGLIADLSIVKAWKADERGNLVFRKTARNFNPMMATAGKVCLVEVEQIVPTGSLDPDHIHTPGIYVDRLIQGTFEKRIEQRTVRQKEGA